jgi:hypothetical protein
MDKLNMTTLTLCLVLRNSKNKIGLDWFKFSFCSGQFFWSISASIFTGQILLPINGWTVLSSYGLRVESDAPNPNLSKEALKYFVDKAKAKISKLREEIKEANKELTKHDIIDDRVELGKMRAEFLKKYPVEDVFKA